MGGLEVPLKGLERKAQPEGVRQVWIIKNHGSCDAMLFVPFQTALMPVTKWGFGVCFPEGDLL